MKLATNEQILKTYNYASVGKVSDTLTVTNKRVVLTTDGKLNDGSKVHTTDEIMLESIERVSAAVATKRNIFYLILSLLFAVAGVALLASGSDGGTLIKLLPFVGTIIFLIVFFVAKQRSFFLVLTSSVKEGMDLSVSVGTWTRKKSSKAVKVKVDEAIVSEIIDEIGAIVVESKN
ncbi:MAG: hypothetical protein J6Q38_05620 [Clostridia bacterium]|nr:hypothetical protein [Clostridia bacterium]